MSVLDTMISRTKALEVPGPASGNDKLLYIILGVLNCLIFGLGMIISGAIAGDSANILIGVCQLLLPFVGWLWGILWGILMIVKAVN